MHMCCIMTVTAVKFSLKPKLVLAQASWFLFCSCHRVCYIYRAVCVCVSAYEPVGRTDCKWWTNNQHHHNQMTGNREREIGEISWNQDRSTWRCALCICVTLSVCVCVLSALFIQQCIRVCQCWSMCIFYIPPVRASLIWLAQLAWC